MCMEEACIKSIQIGIWRGACTGIRLVFAPCNKAENAKVQKPGDGTVDAS